jgi:hypothetical protein
MRGIDMMTKMMKWLMAVVVSMFVACPGYQSKSDRLTIAIREIHTLLKFKEYLRATDYVIPFYRKDFMEIFGSGSVMVEDYEIRGLETDSKNMNKVNVTVRLLIRTKNSMTIKFARIQERWIYVGGSWKLAHIKRLLDTKRPPSIL